MSNAASADAHSSHIIHPKTCTIWEMQAQKQYYNQSFDEPSNEHERKRLLPMINIFNDFISPSFTVRDVQIVLDPSYYVVLECSLDKLVQEIGGEKLVDVGAGKIMSERLGYQGSVSNAGITYMLIKDVINNVINMLLTWSLVEVIKPMLIILVM